MLVGSLKLKKKMFGRFIEFEFFMVGWLNLRKTNYFLSISGVFQIVERLSDFSCTKFLYFSSIKF